jgi:hypothetical protein
LWTVNIPEKGPDIMSINRVEALFAEFYSKAPLTRQLFFPEKENLKSHEHNPG